MTNVSLLIQIINIWSNVNIIHSNCQYTSNVETTNHKYCLLIWDKSKWWTHLLSITHQQVSIRDDYQMMFMIL